MTPKEADDNLKYLVAELDSAFCAACQVWFDNGLIPMDGIEHGSIPLSIEFPAEWKTSPPSEEAAFQILATLEFLEFWSNVMEQIEVYYQGGKPGDIKSVPEQANQWLHANGYGDLVGKLLDEVSFDWLLRSMRANLPS